MSTRVALVTGGNRGLGLEIARQLAQRGLRVVLAARSLDKAQRAAESLRGEQLDVVARELDVASAESTAGLSELGTIDVLVNNAGVMAESDENPLASGRSVAAGSTLLPDLLREAFETNTLGAYRVIQALAPGHARAWLRTHRQCVLGTGPAERHGRRLSGLPRVEGGPERADADLRLRAARRAGCSSTRSAPAGPRPTWAAHTPSSSPKRRSPRSSGPRRSPMMVQRAPSSAPNSRSRGDGLVVRLLEVGVSRVPRTDRVSSGRATVRSLHGQASLGIDGRIQPSAECASSR